MDTASAPPTAADVHASTAAAEALAEGKTKLILPCREDRRAVVVLSKDTITAGNGAKVPPSLPPSFLPPPPRLVLRHTSLTRRWFSVDVVAVVVVVVQRDVVEGKGRLSNETACSVFRLLQLSGLPTHFLGQEAPDSFRYGQAPAVYLHDAMPHGRGD